MKRTPGYRATFATMYLDWRGEWRLPPLNGIASAPLLREDGTIQSTEGYDVASAMWRENVPDLSGYVPDQPTADDAASALLLIRETFKTFCFADAETMEDSAMRTGVVNTSVPPGKDESGFLAALLTAVCRPSLHLAPGVCFYGRRPCPAPARGRACSPAASQSSHSAESRTRSQAAPVRQQAGFERCIIRYRGTEPDCPRDNQLECEPMRDVITERPSRVRLLGRSQMVPLSASSLVILTGNGLTVTEDLARRFIVVEFDPRTEDPEARSFTTDIRTDVTHRRAELLAAALTIWRWGRTAHGIVSGRTLGSFEQWCGWVRDRLLALGCKDPADRVSETKERDGRRQAIAELFAVWWERHQDRPVAVCDLHDDVRHIADLQARGRPICSTATSKPLRPMRSGSLTSPTSQLTKAGSTSPPSRIWPRWRSSAGRCPSG